MNWQIYIIVSRVMKLPLRVNVKWQFLSIFLVVVLVIFLLHLGWKRWLLSIPQPLPQKSIIPTEQQDKLEHGIYYEISVPPTGSAKYISADYRIWIPNGVETVRGVIVKQHGCGGDADSDLGLVYANDLQWQALAIKHQLALLGSKYPTDYQTVGRYPDDPCNSWAVIDHGSEKALLKALYEFGQNSRHPELEKIPWVLWGYSGGADWAVQMSQKYPDRTIALIAQRGGGVVISPSAPNKLLTSDINPAILEMPVLYALGGAEAVGTVYFDEGLDIPRKVFSRFRKAGALWAIAVEADMGHQSTDTRLISIPYLDSILTSRLTTTSTKLQQLNKSNGWLANPVTQEIAPVGEYKGDALEAAWLPDQQTAYKWKSYVTAPNLWDKARYSFCSSKKLLTLLGLPHLSESCYPDRVSSTRKPDAPTDVRAIKISASEVVLTWNFTPDLENGLPKFRIYRNYTLIATLQGQERDGGDAPIYPHVVLEFRDTSAEENGVYAVSAFNNLGENISQFSRILPSQ
jgi:pimeloyl-ACP methyl ester carboxylesterase